MGRRRRAREAGLTAVELFDALAAGDVKMVWIACTNPAQSMPDQATVRAGLARAELVVLQEAYADTETAAFADVLLPATTWGEKEGTVTNSERRISRVRAARAGARRGARRLGDRRRLRAAPRGATCSLRTSRDADAVSRTRRPSEMFREHVATTARARSRHHRPLATRCSTRAARSSGRFRQARRAAGSGSTPTACSRRRTAARASPPCRTCRSRRSRDARYPFRLNTGRLRDQWHGMSRTGTVAQLFEHAGEPALQLHRRRSRAARPRRRRPRPRRVAARQHRRAGRGERRAEAGSGVPADALGQREPRRRRRAGVNALTTPARCPVSEQPELKHAAVRVTKAELPWRLAAFGYASRRRRARAARRVARAARVAFRSRASR